MKRIISLIGLILIAAIGTVLLVPYILSAETIREAMADQIEAATGREITFSGSASLSVFPALNVHVRGVTIANAPGLDGEPFAAMDELGATLRLMPLLTGDIEFDRLIMVRPRINLATDANGTPNWNFGGAPGGKAAGSDATRDTAPPPAVVFDEFLIRDGQVTFSDGRSGERFEASGVNASVSWPSRAAPLGAEGTFVWRGEVADFKLRCDDPISLATKGKSTASIMMETNRLTVDISGQFSTAVDLAVDGQIGLRVPSVPALARWFGVELPVAAGFNDLSLKSKFVVGGPKLSFSDAVLSLDGNAAEGAVIIRFGEPRPLFQATLALSALNLNPYTGAGEAKGKGADAQAGKHENGWSTRPFPLDGLGAIDADVRISAGKITARDIPLGSGALTISLKDRVLTAQVAQLQAYAGEINGSLTVNAAGDVPRMTLSGSAQKTDLQPFLRDAASFDRLRGKGDVSVNLTGSGRHARALVGGLNGTAQLTAANGAIYGIDAVAMIRGLRDRQLEGWGSGEGAETPFDRLHATFAVQNGTARNDDLVLQGPSLDIQGQGMVDLPQKRLDYRVSASLVERSGPADNQTVRTVVTIPTIIRGPWDDPLILPDPVAMLNSSPEARETIEKAKEALRQGDLEGAADALKEKGVDGLLDALTGGKKSSQ